MTDESEAHVSLTASVCRRTDVQYGVVLLCAALFCAMLNQTGQFLLAISLSYKALLSAMITTPVRLVTSISWYSCLSIVAIVSFSYILSFVLSYGQRQKRRFKRVRVNHSRPVHVKLNFPTTIENYFTRRQKNKAQPFVYPESEGIEREFTRVLELILNKYVESWYTNVSQKPLFPSAIEHLIRSALISLKDRLKSTDVVGTMVRRAVPILTQHLHEFAIAEQSAKQTVQEIGSDALEHDVLIDAFTERCKHRVLHLAAQPSEYDEEHVIEPENKLQTYLRGIVERLLPDLLPAHELEAKIVKTFIREMLACAVLSPIFDMLSESDFWNAMIVTKAHEVIQVRARVKRFRHVLKEQTRDQVGMSKSMKKRPQRNLERLMTSKDSRDWDRLYRKIKKSQSLADISRMRNEIVILRSEMNAAASYPTDGYLTDGSHVRTTTKSDHFAIKAMSLLDARYTVLSGKTVSFKTTLTPSNVSFDHTLATGVSYFFAFMERQNRVALLDFWHRIMQIKLRSTQTIPESQLSILDSPVHLNQDEISMLYHTYFSNPLLTITDEECSTVCNYIKREPDLYDIDSNEVIIAVAHRTYRTMEVEDFPMFKRDPLYLNMVSAVESTSIDVPPVRSPSFSALHAMFSNDKHEASRTSFDAVDLSREYLSNETMGMLDITEKDVLEAMGDALTLPLVNRHDSRHTSEDVSVSGRTSPNSFREKGFAGIHERSSVCSDPSAQYQTTAIDSMENSLSDLQSAEPGDLGIIEQIENLDREITKRVESIRYIDKFLSSKRDIDDLDRKVVNKSRLQTSRELDNLRDKKRQYEADDHSLFGRSSVKIERSITREDSEGNEYVAYVIEVNRTTPDGSKVGWLIARRYSEFNELLSQLKVKFPLVNTLDFPKKQLNRLKSVSEVRRPILESFLKNLLKEEKICRSLELRTFLSQSNETVKKKQHKTVIENLIGLTDPREAFAKLFTLLETPDDVKKDNPDLRQVHPAPHDAGEDDLSSFAKPIVDLVLEAFDLRERSKWIKKKAVVLILQQVLGGTIESRVRDHISILTNDQSLKLLLHTLRTQIEGQGAEQTYPTSSKSDRQRLQDLAHETLRAYNPSYIPESAAKKVFRALQIKTLNRHLLGRLTDAFLDAIFPTTQ